MRLKLIQHIMPLVAMLLLTVFVIVERVGITRNNIELTKVYDSEKTERMGFTDSIEGEKDTVILIDSSVKINSNYEKDINRVLHDFKVNYDVFDVVNGNLPDNINNYKKAILTFSNLKVFSGESMKALLEWVRLGGNLMSMASFEPENNFSICYDKFGIISYGTKTSIVNTLTVKDNYMIGGNKSYKIDNSSILSLELSLSKEAKVIIESDNKIPILWKNDYGDGSFVCINMNVYGKGYRGIFGTAYSLLGDYMVYPVINGSSFYIDDYPLPILEENNQYITKDYGVNVETFYTDIWLKDVFSWEQEYGIIHTGFLVENYDRNMTAPFNVTADTKMFKYLGNTFLNRGNELGWHGFNHMPLCLKGFDYQGLYDSYVLWDSKEDMAGAVKAMYDFGKELFPKQDFAVYVPPSNVISKEGREVLAKNVPGIKAIAASYWEGNCVYEQEFEVGDYGLINTPRITSGCNLASDDYMSAFSELNYHFVQTHFTHPDDALDPDRGALEGWESLDNQFRCYLDYLKQAAPDIRSLCGSDMAEAVKRFDNLSVKTYREGDKIHISLGGFCDEAYLLMRINSEELIGSNDFDLDNFKEQVIDGGSMKAVARNLYLIHAEKPELIIERQVY